jgi:hypothetical protein
MLVIVSWIGFWLDSRSITARAVLGLMTLLMMIILSLGIDAKIAAVSYIKPVDIWIGVGVYYK